MLLALPVPVTQVKMKTSELTLLILQRGNQDDARSSVSGREEGVEVNLSQLHQLPLTLEAETFLRKNEP